MKMKTKLAQLLGVVALGFSMSATAVPITVDAGWYGFCFGGVGNTVSQGCQNEGIGTTGMSSEFTSSGSTLFKITDAFLIGDIFDVWIDGAFAFQTSTPGSGSTTTNPDVAFADPDYSSGSWLLAAGSYVIEVFVAASPFGGGGAYLEVESVPEPGTLALLGIGLAGMGLMRRRKKV